MRDQDEMFEAATETPASLGCPSLGPKTLPSGFDGTEPASRTVAASATAPSSASRGGRDGTDVADLNEILFDRLGEIVRMCCKVREECLRLVGVDDAEENLKLFAAFSELRQMCDFYRPGAPKAKPLMKRCAKTPQTIVQQFTLPSGRCLSAEWLVESTGHRAEAYLYDDERCVCRIEFCDAYQSRNIGFAITRQALRGLVSRAGHMGRYRANKKAMNGGAK